MQAFVTPCIIACQPPLSMGFPRQEYWSSLPFPVPGDLSNPGIKLASLLCPTLADRFFTIALPRKSHVSYYYLLNHRKWKIFIHLMLFCQNNCSVPSPRFFLLNHPIYTPFRKIVLNHGLIHISFTK